MNNNNPWKIISVLLLLISSCSYKSKHLDTWIIDPQAEGWDIRVECAYEDCYWVGDEFYNDELELELEFPPYLGKKDYRDYVCLRLQFNKFPEGMEYTPSETILKNEDSKNLNWESRPCWTPQNLTISRDRYPKADKNTTYALNTGEENIFYFYLEEDPATFQRVTMKIDGITKNTQPYTIPELTIVRNKKIKTRPIQ